MRTWRAAHARTTCGFAGCRIDEGQPVQVIQIGGLPPRFRCQEHATGEVDWDEVQASKSFPVSTSAEPRGFTRVSRIKSTFDPKLAAAGERDE